MDGKQTSNILAEGLSGLLTMKNTLAQLEQYKAESVSLDEQDALQEKQIRTKEKEMADAIATVTKNRRAELETAYSEQTARTKARIKKVQGRKEKEKTTRISERIQEESQEMREEYANFFENIRQLYKEDKCPRIVNNRLFYAIFQPISFNDFLAIVLVLAVVLFVIPCGTYYAFFRPKTWFLALTYIVTVVAFGAVYLVLRHKVKEKHDAMFKLVRELRIDAKQKKKEIKKLERSIKKDHDESSYGLERYNKDLSELEEELEAIEAEKKAALKKFDTDTKNEIAKEVGAKLQQEIDKLKEENEVCDQKQREVAEKIKSLSTLVSDKYTPYLGKENLGAIALEQLEQIMRSGEAKTIAEALEVQKHRQASAGK